MLSYNLFLLACERNCVKVLTYLINKGIPADTLDQNQDSGFALCSKNRKQRRYWIAKRRKC